MSTTARLPVMEHFYTIQGEGYYSGTAAYFVRLGGCDVGCPWCDVKESWSTEGHPLWEISDIAELAVNAGAPAVVVTGGEPMMHRLHDLTQQIQAKGIRTHVETSGAHPLSGAWDWICLSPKKFKKPLETYYEEAHELKVIVYHPSDFKFAEEQRSLIKMPSCKLYLQPEWSKTHEITPLIVDYVKLHPEWNISLQTHKYMDIP